MGKSQLDRGTVAGVLIAITGVIAGLWLDGGSLRQVLQPTAALIVLGGTLGAILIQFPFKTVQQAAAQTSQALFYKTSLTTATVEELAGWCMQARKHGLLSIDSKLERIEDLFLRKSLTLAVDNLPLLQLRETMEIDLDLEEERAESIVRVIDAAGGFAPTLGIIGAVMGLIQVMQRMDNVGEIGRGIAVAFVSTLYGIGVANLVFLPLAGKLRIRMRERQLMHEMTLDAVIAIAQGISARSLRQRLQGYLAAGKVTPEAKAQVQLVTQ